MTEPISRSAHQALKALYRLSPDGGETSTGALAEGLGASPAAATAAVKRLAERALVDHHPYRGVTLTTAGRRAAVAAIRRHRIVERFLADMLGYPWHEADRHAVAFEHELPEEVLGRIYVALDRPETCPHGFPIPAHEVDELPPLPPLGSLEPGDRAVVAVPGSTGADVVAFLETLGLRPGVEVEVREKHPFEGPVVLRVGDVDRTVSFRVAEQIYVRDRPTGAPL